MQKYSHPTFKTKNPGFIHVSHDAEISDGLRLTYGFCSWNFLCWNNGVKARVTRGMKELEGNALLNPGNAQTGASALAGFLGAPTCNVRVAPSTSTHTMPCICGCSFAHNLCVFPSGELIVNSPFHPSRELRCFSSCHFPVPIAESDFFLPPSSSWTPLVVSDLESVSHLILPMTSESSALRRHGIPSLRAMAHPLDIARCLTCRRHL